MRGSVSKKCKEIGLTCFICFSSLIQCSLDQPSVGGTPSFSWFGGLSSQTVHAVHRYRSHDSHMTCSRPVVLAADICLYFPAIFMFVFLVYRSLSLEDKVSESPFTSLPLAFSLS